MVVTYKVAGELKMVGVTVASFDTAAQTSFRLGIAAKLGVSLADVEIVSFADESTKSTKLKVDYKVATANEAAAQTAAAVMADPVVVKTAVNQQLQADAVPILIESVETEVQVQAEATYEVDPFFSHSPSPSPQPGGETDNIIIFAAVGGVGGALVIGAALVIFKKKKVSPTSTQTSDPIKPDAIMASPSLPKATANQVSQQEHIDQYDGKTVEVDEAAL